MSWQVCTSLRREDCRGAICSALQFQTLKLRRRIGKLRAMREPFFFGLATGRWS